MSTQAVRDAAPRAGQSQQVQEPVISARLTPTTADLFEGSVPAGPARSFSFSEEERNERHEPRLWPHDDAIRHVGEGFSPAPCPRRMDPRGPSRRRAWLILERPDILPERDLPGLIRRYNESVGGVNSDTEGYHETITQVFIRTSRAGAGASAKGRGCARGSTRCCCRPRGGGTGRCAFIRASACSRRRRGSAGWSRTSSCSRSRCRTGQPGLAGHFLIIQKLEIGTGIYLSPGLSTSHYSQTQRAKRHCLAGMDERIRGQYNRRKRF